MFEAYSIGIRLSLLGNVSGGLLRLVRDFRTAEMSAAGLRKELKSIGATMLVGGAMTAVGLGILGAFKPALNEAKRFQQEMTKFSLYGMGDAANREATRFAKAMDVVGSSYVDNFRLINEAQGVFRESGAMNLSQQLQGAKIAAPLLAKLSFIESGLSEDQRSSRHAQDLAMLRFVEARGGANDPRTFASIADWGFKLQQSSGGIVDWAGLQRLAAQAGPMTRTLSQDAISKLEPVIGDLTGGRVGSGLRVAFQRLLGTQRGLPRQAVAEYLKLGLWDPSKVELTKQGGIKQFLGQPGEVFKDRLNFLSDPVSFYEKTFLPALAKKYGPGILGDSPDAVAKRSVEQSLIFGPGTASQVFSQIDKLMPAIQRSLAAQNKQVGIDGAYNATRGTFAGKQIELAARFRSLLVQTGEVALPIAVAGLEALLPVLKGISDFSQKHPRIFGDLVTGVLALGAALTASGIITMLVGVGRAFSLFGKVFKPLSKVAEFAPKIISGFESIGGAAALFAGRLATIARTATGAVGASAAGVGSAGWLAGLGPLGALGIGLFNPFFGGAKASGEASIRAHHDAAAKGGGLNGLLYASVTKPMVDFAKGFSTAFVNGMKPALTAWGQFGNKLADTLHNLFPLLFPSRSHQARVGAEDHRKRALAETAQAQAYAARAHRDRQVVDAFRKKYPNYHAAADPHAMHNAGTAAGTIAAQWLSGLLKPPAWLQSMTAASQKSASTVSDSNKALGQSNTKVAGQITTAVARLASELSGLNFTVNMDGRKVGAIVGGYLGKALGGPNTGIPRHDPRASMAAPGAGHSR